MQLHTYKYNIRASQRKLVQKSGPEDRSTRLPEYQSTGVQEYLGTGGPEDWKTGVLDYWTTGLLDYYYIVLVVDP